MIQNGYYANIRAASQSNASSTAYTIALFIWLLILNCRKRTPFTSSRIFTPCLSGRSVSVYGPYGPCVNNSHAYALSRNYTFAFFVHSFNGTHTQFDATKSVLCSVMLCAMQFHRVHMHILCCLHAFVCAHVSTTTRYKCTCE